MTDHPVPEQPQDVVRVHEQLMPADRVQALLMRAWKLCHAQSFASAISLHSLRLPNSTASLRLGTCQASILLIHHTQDCDNMASDYCFDWNNLLQNAAMLLPDSASWWLGSYTCRAASSKNTTSSWFAILWERASPGSSSFRMKFPSSEKSVQPFDFLLAAREHPYALLHHCYTNISVINGD